MEKAHTIFIKSHQDKRILHELLVGEHRVKNRLHVCGGVGDVGIVGVVGQVGDVEHVVRGVGSQGHIFGEVLLGVDDVTAARGAVADVVKGHEGVVLAGGS